jgi:CRP/FNR family transcriptional regulator, cyclic AMP receptor protein
MDSTDKMLLIRNYDLWSHLSDQEYEALNLVHNFVEAKKGNYVYFEAFNHNKLYFLKEGYIRIGYIDDEGNEVIKEIIQKGEIFGQITLDRENLNGEFARAYKADVSICAFNVHDFQRLLQTRPELALKYNRLVGAKYRQIENRLVNLLNKDVKTRLTSFLWQLVQLHAPESGQSLCIPNYLTHEDIAHLIGSSRQTVTTMINELVSEGTLVYNRQEICFPDVNKFQKSANVT